MLDLLLPQRCLGCSRPGSHLCDWCRATLPRLRAPLCDRCGAPTAWPVARCRECAGRRLAFASARAAVAYEGAARRLATSWKERGLRRLAELAADLVAETVARPAASALVFVPPDGDRSRRRGHDPPAQLARELGERWELRGPGRTRAGPPARAPARAGPRGAAPKRGRRVRAPRQGPADGRARRRRLHERLDGRGRRERPPPRRRAKGRGRHLRAGGSLPSEVANQGGFHATSG